MWDEVVLRVEDAFGYVDKVPTRLKVMIIGIDEVNEVYLCYVPPYERIPHGFGTFTIDARRARYYGTDDKFIGDTGCFISDNWPTYKHIVAPIGEKCDICKTFFEGTTKPPGGAYRCRSCRENAW